MIFILYAFVLAYIGFFIGMTLKSEVLMWILTGLGLLSPILYTAEKYMKLLNKGTSLPKEWFDEKNDL